MSFRQYWPYSSFRPVKLNNPLMGTETVPSSDERVNLGTGTVKLNNPLMGTETTNNFKLPTNPTHTIWLN